MIITLKVEKEKVRMLNVNIDLHDFIYSYIFNRCNSSSLNLVKWKEIARVDLHPPTT